MMNMNVIHGGQVNVTAQSTASISEIFSSLQGEGIHLGERHLFVRFERCNIHCDYCDELGKPGADFDLESVVESLKKLECESGPHAFVSLMGGEPLVYTPFLKRLIPRLKEEKFKIYLETNGILHRQLAAVVRGCDVIAMDVKPASVTGERSFLQEHSEFLKIALNSPSPRPLPVRQAGSPLGRGKGEGCELFIKMIVSKEIHLNEFQELCSMICSHDERIPLILQPISGTIEGHEDPVLMRLLGQLQTIALGMLNDVRIIPRLHKILKIK